MKNAFTMIELIFVIVILGILSSVAIAKFKKVSDNAEYVKCKAYIDVLNRTVGTAIWTNAYFNDKANLATSVTATTLDAQIDTPSECGTSTMYATIATNNSSVIQTISGSDYNISGTAPTDEAAPSWSITKQ